MCDPSLDFEACLLVNTEKAEARIVRRFQIGGMTGERQYMVWFFDTLRSTNERSSLLCACWGQKERFCRNLTLWWHYFRQQNETASNQIKVGIIWIVRIFIYEGKSEQLSLFEMKVYIYVHFEVRIQTVSYHFCTPNFKPIVTSLRFFVHNADWITQR